MISEPAEVAMAIDLADPNRLGFGYGLYDFVGSIGIAVRPVLGGYLYDAVGSGIPLYTNGIILLISADWVLVFLGRHKRDD